MRNLQGGRFGVHTRPGQVPEVAPKCPKPGAAPQAGSTKAPRERPPERLVSGRAADGSAVAHPHHIALWRRANGQRRTKPGFSPGNPWRAALQFLRVTNVQRASFSGYPRRAAPLSPRWYPADVA